MPIFIRSTRIYRTKINTFQCYYNLTDGFTEEREHGHADEIQLPQHEFDKEEIVSTFDNF